MLSDGDRLYLVLEHCEGGDLAQKIKLKTETTDGFSEAEVCVQIQKLYIKYLIMKLHSRCAVIYTRNKELDE